METCTNSNLITFFFFYMKFSNQFCKPNKQYSMFTQSAGDKPGKKIA